MLKVVSAVMVGVLASLSVVNVAQAAPKVYKNCVEMNKVYKHGVGLKGAKDKHSASSKPVTNFKVDAALYNANKKRDGDKDKIACEKR